MAREGNCAIRTEISRTIVQSLTACSQEATSKVRSSSWKASRFSDARLQAVSSRNMYSEQGFEARIGPETGQVCQSLMVVWNWMPGSAEAQAAWPIFSHRSRALSVFTVLPERRALSAQSSSASTALRKASSTRTELFEFWPETVR